MRAAALTVLLVIAHITLIEAVGREIQFKQYGDHPLRTKRSEESDSPGTPSRGRSISKFTVQPKGRSFKRPTAAASRGRTFLYPSETSNLQRNPTQTQNSQYEQKNELAPGGRGFSSNTATSTVRNLLTGSVTPNYQNPVKPTDVPMDAIAAFLAAMQASWKASEALRQRALETSKSNCSVPEHTAKSEINKPAQQPSDMLNHSAIANRIEIQSGRSFTNFTAATKGRSVSNFVGPTNVGPGAPNPMVAEMHKPNNPGIGSNVKNVLLNCTIENKLVKCIIEDPKAEESGKTAEFPKGRTVEQINEPPVMADKMAAAAQGRAIARNVEEPKRGTGRSATRLPRRKRK